MTTPVIFDVQGSPRQRFLYVLAFSSGTIKVGQSREPEKRLASHDRNAQQHGHAVTRSWVSVPHANYGANEEALIAFCSSRWEASGGREYFPGADFDEVADFAQTLPFQRLSPDEEQALDATASEKAKAAVEALRTGLGALSLEQILPSRLQLRMGANWYDKFTAAVAKFRDEYPGRELDADVVAVLARQVFAEMSRLEYEDALNHLVIGYWVDLVEEERDAPSPLIDIARLAEYLKSGGAA